MPDLTYLQAKALRIRSAVESLTDADDLAVVRDYLTELELRAAQGEAEDARRMVGAQH